MDFRFVRWLALVNFVLSPRERFASAQPWSSRMPLGGAIKDSENGINMTRHFNRNTIDIYEIINFHHEIFVVFEVKEASIEYCCQITRNQTSILPHNATESWTPHWRHLWRPLKVEAGKHTKSAIWSSLQPSQTCRDLHHLAPYESKKSPAHCIFSSQKVHGTAKESQHRMSQTHHHYFSHQSLLHEPEQGIQ